MTTLTIMKARISDELRRDDLTSDIADAINSAIDQYSSSIQYFTASRQNTFNTVAGTFQYTKASTGCAFFARIIRLNYVFAIVGGQPSYLKPLTMEMMEYTNLGNGFSPSQPIEYAWFGQEMHLNNPNDVYEIRVGAQLSVAAPATDGEADNIWMTDCERAVRSFAKGELYSQVIKDRDKAQQYYDVAASAWSKIELKSEQLATMGGGEVRPFSM